MLGYSSWYSEEVTGFLIRGSNLGRENKYFSVDRHRGPNHYPCNGHQGPFPKVDELGREVITVLHLQPSSRMNHCKTLVVLTLYIGA